MLPAIYFCCQRPLFDSRFEVLRHVIKYINPDSEMTVIGHSAAIGLPDGVTSIFVESGLSQDQCLEIIETRRPPSATVDLFCPGWLMRASDALERIPLTVRGDLDIGSIVILCGGAWITDDLANHSKRFTEFSVCLCGDGNAIDWEAYLQWFNEVAEIKSLLAFLQSQTSSDWAVIVEAGY